VLTCEGNSYVQFRLPRSKCFNIRMNGVEFSAKELKELVASYVSCVRVHRRVCHISLLPKYLGDTKSAFKECHSLCVCNVE
jgi:hypothetical protein